MQKKQHHVSPFVYRTSGA